MRRQFCCLQALTFVVGSVCVVSSWALTFGQDVSATADAARPANSALVVVNGQPVTQGDVDLLMLSRRVPKPLRAGLQKQALEQLIDRRLLQAYLATRKVEPSAKALDAQVAAIHKVIRRAGDDPNKVLSKLGYSEQSLRKELALPLAWQQHFRLIVTAKQVREYWQQHRHEFDGTQVRAAHILLKAKTEAERAAATAKLKQLRSEIVGGKLTFADAAKQHSQAPSRDNGGDLGFFAYRGKMTLEFSKAAFPLKTGEVSQPFDSPFGVHLLTVTARKPGQLSLEDARPEVLDRLSDQIQSELVQRERVKAKIEWKVELP